MAVRNLNLPQNTKGQCCSYGGGQRSGEGQVQAICSVTCQNGILERTSKLRLWLRSRLAVHLLTG